MHSTGKSIGIEMGGTTSSGSTTPPPTPPAAPTGLADAAIINGYVNAAQDTTTQQLTGSAEAGGRSASPSLARRPPQATQLQLCAGPSRRR
ncbi:hypothetical protein BJA5080_03409 [Bradyrhizobium diazoefficiens SEMIA 5080]|uniref:Uncharacterized protein n=1 Tax=Bradyrhizobium diazoefficiens SEMIA 5080 TaxID=754504 RepID=A0A837CC01_9BRAD|nr:hypothetical protein BJA5080_03409 [Bradyrhizobium diazoefficiens SEMIA 5080]